jgi:hypothetical protein
MCARIVWEHVSGDRWILVYPDRKVRTGPLWPDVAPVVWRAGLAEAVPDSVWYARPGDEWRAG